MVDVSVEICHIKTFKFWHHFNSDIGYYACMCTLA